MAGTYDWRWNYDPSMWQSMGYQGGNYNSQAIRSMQPSAQPTQGYQPQMPTAGGMTSPGLGYYQPGFQSQQYDPNTFGQLVAPSYLQGQQATFAKEQFEARKKAGSELAASLGLGDLVKFTDDSDIQAGLESIPIAETLAESKRNIENRYARGGTALSSEYGRDIAQAEGAAMTAIRQSKTLADLQQKQNYLTAYLRAMSSYMGG